MGFKDFLQLKWIRKLMVPCLSVLYCTTVSHNIAWLIWSRSDAKVSVLKNSKRSKMIRTVKSPMPMVTFRLTGGRSCCTLLLQSPPKMTVFSGSLSAVLTEHMAPTMHPLLSSMLRPTWAARSKVKIVSMTLIIY